MNEAQKIAEVYKQMKLEEAKKKMDPVGDADADIDNDGDVDDSDEYLHKRRKAIKKSMKEEQTECPKCKGDGCDHCDNKGYHEALEIDPDDGETKKTSDKDDKKKKKATDSSSEEPMQEAAPKISMGNAKGTISATGMRGKGMKKYDVNVSVTNGKLEFKIKDEQGKFQTVGIKQAARMLGEDVEVEEAKKPAVRKLGAKDIKRALQSPANKAKPKDKVSLKKAPWESVNEVDEPSTDLGKKFKNMHKVEVDDTEEKGHMDAVKANKAGPRAKQPKRVKDLRK